MVGDQLSSQRSRQPECRLHAVGTFDHGDHAIGACSTGHAPAASTRAGSLLSLVQCDTRHFARGAGDRSLRPDSALITITSISSSCP